MPILHHSREANGLYDSVPENVRGTNEGATAPPVWNSVDRSAMILDGEGSYWGEDIPSQKGAQFMSEQDNLKLTRESIAAINAGDLDRFLSYLDESHVWENEAFPSPVQGREGARRILGMYFEAFPDLRFEIERVITSGDQVVTCWRMTGTHKAQFRGPGALDIPATNKQISSRGCTVADVKNGRVVRSVDYSDRLAVLRQLGVLPVGKPAAA
jgi:steroid delta-isomerase-like uncharacterized protein